MRDRGAQVEQVPADSPPKDSVFEFATATATSSPLAGAAGDSGGWFRLDDERVRACRLDARCLSEMFGGSQEDDSSSSGGDSSHDSNSSDSGSGSDIDSDSVEEEGGDDSSSSSTSSSNSGNSSSSSGSDDSEEQSRRRRIARPCTAYLLVYDRAE